MHPVSFKEHYVLAQPAPYSFSFENRPSASGGVLNGGRAVWLQESLPPAKAGTVCAFVDDLGMIYLDSRWLLKRALDPAAPTPYISAQLAISKIPLLS